MCILLMLLSKRRQEKNEYIKYSMQKGRKDFGSYGDYAMFRYNHSGSLVKYTKKHELMLLLYKQNIDPFYVTDEWIAYRFFKGSNQIGNDVIPFEKSFVWIVEFTPKGYYQNDYMISEDDFSEKIKNK